MDNNVIIINAPTDTSERPKVHEKIIIFCEIVIPLTTFQYAENKNSHFNHKFLLNRHKLILQYAYDEDMLLYGGRFLVATVLSANVV